IPGSFDVLAANHPDAAERKKSRELFQRGLEFTTLLGCKHMTMLPGIPWPNETLTDSTKRSSEELAWRVVEAKKAGVAFGVEPHLESIIETPEASLEFAKNTPGITYTLDYTHFTYQGIPDDRIEPLIKHASHFHARGAAKERLQMPVKLNVID